MTIDRAVLAFAGFMVLLSVALAYPRLALVPVAHRLHGPEPIQSAFTGFCPAALVFKGLGCKVGEAFR